ncbi:hypothetical protein AB0M12_04355 [Nocardia vinacea]|uniref:hypothetical protein n=1 Tax=Nocardia vinacea TaxID=96468 RepID=UPI00342F20DB
MDTAFMGLTSSRDVTASGTLPARISTRPTIFLSVTFADGADAWRVVASSDGGRRSRP